jgi:OmcA/MtrC family decaheme c-type cytochrome
VTCQNCHDAQTFGLYGGSRRDAKLCVMCHQPQTVDPDTGNTLDMKVMIHKIHVGEELFEPYIIYGNQQSKHDYSEVVFPTLTGGLRNCTKCHETPATQNDLWLTAPSRDAARATTRSTGRPVKSTPATETTTRGLPSARQRR